MRLATALARATPRVLPGAGVGVGDAPPPSRAPPRGLRGNRRRAREEGGKHEERGFLRAETGVDLVGEGGCGRWRGKGGSRAARLSRRRVSSVSRAPGQARISPSAPQPLGPQEGTIPTRLPVSEVENKRVVTYSWVAGGSVSTACWSCPGQFLVLQTRT